MNTPITGLHHITAVASDPQRNVDFYSGLLGLRLVKKTVNFDDPSAYHLYYGNETGEPSTAITFFYWPGHDFQGRVGPGQSVAIVFSAPADSLDYWEDRLNNHSVNTTRGSRFGEQTLRFSDPDGIPLEIVAVAKDRRAPWAGNGVPAERALRGMHTAALSVATAEPTEKLVSEIMGYRLVGREGDQSRFEVGEGGSGRYIDILAQPDDRSSCGGTGTIHHVAWAVPDDEAQARMRALLERSGFAVSPAIDRDYFHSIYFRERGGILFEIATAGPGFAVDEPVESLGEQLRLPKQVELHRASIESALPPLRPAAIH